MRIIGGSAARRTFDAPPGLAVRPTPDRVRQALFNSLGGLVDDAQVLDLFSGSGALGLECLSRGARVVVSVELSSRHARCIRDNAAHLALPRERHEIRVQDVFTALRQLAPTERRFDLVFADPPFGEKTHGERSKSLSQALLDDAVLPGLLVPGGRLVLGHARRDGITIPPPWVGLKRFDHGDSIFHLVVLEDGKPKADEAVPVMEPGPDS